MRSASPYPLHMRCQRARSRSLSSYYGTSSGTSRPYSDTSFIHQHHRTGAPFARRSVSTQPPSVSRLSSLIERTLDCDDETATTTDESKSLLGSEDTVTAVYTRRWYLLLVFSSVALLQTMSWAIWGPISESAESVFGWDDSNITMCLFLGNLTFCVCCIPFSWLMDRKGLRLCVVVTSFCVMAGAGLRCLIHFIPSDYHTWCIYSGQLLNGIAGPVAQGGGALFSNLWFPNNQRASSTALSTFIGYAGSALAFVLGPMLIPSPADDPDNNNTLPDGNNFSMPVRQIMLTALGSGNSSSDGTTNASMMKDAILQYIDYLAVASVVVFVMVVVYFPDKPPRPPSLSAASDREDYLPGIANLLKNKQFWLISMAFCMSLGVFEVWDAVLDVNLSTIGISQETAGWLGFYCVMAGCVAGLIICRLGDIFFRQIRLFLLVSYVVSAVFVLWFILIYIGVLPFDIASIYAAIILSGVFLDGCSPLVYELVCEAAYPVSEGVSSCFLQMIFVLIGMVFAAIQNVPNIGTEWMNWCLLGTLCAAIPLLLCVTDVYGRADIDDLENEITVVNTPENPSMQDEGWTGEKEPLLNRRTSAGNTPCSTLSPSPCNPSPLPSLLSPFTSFPPRSSPGYGACSCPPELVFIPNATGITSERGRTQKEAETEKSGEDGDRYFGERDRDRYTEVTVRKDTGIDKDGRGKTEIDICRDIDSVAAIRNETERDRTDQRDLEAADLRTMEIDRNAERDRDTVAPGRRTDTETELDKDRRTKKNTHSDRKTRNDSDSFKKTIHFANDRVNIGRCNDDLESHSRYQNGSTRGNVGPESSLRDQSRSFGSSWSSRDASLSVESELKSSAVGVSRDREGMAGHRPGSGSRYSSSPTSSSASGESGFLLTSSRSPDLSFLRMELGGT